MIRQIDTELQSRPRLQEACIRLTAIANNLEPGAKLPPMTALREQLGMSLGTLNDAVRKLNEEGILRSVSGVGVYVAQINASEKCSKLGVLFRSHRAQKNSSDIYLQKVLLGIQQEAARHNWEVTLLNENTETVTSNNLDALLLLCHVSEALVMNLPENLPHVLLFQHSPDFACVVPDDFEAIKIATEQLIHLGHTRIAYLAGIEYDSITRQRVAGYHAALREAGIEPNATYIRHLTRKHPECSYLEQGERAMNAWLNDGWRDLKCTAILGHNDYVGIGMMKALHSHGFCIPRDVSIVGFDGTQVSELCTPTLASIIVPLEEIGARAVKVLLEQIKENEVRTEKNVLPVQFKEGESIAAYTEELTCHSS